MVDIDDYTITEMPGTKKDGVWHVLKPKRPASKSTQVAPKELQPDGEDRSKWKSDK